MAILKISPEINTDVFVFMLCYKLAPSDPPYVHSINVVVANTTS